MKILIIILVIIPCLAWGQKKDSYLYINFKSVGRWHPPIINQQDTIKVLMLVCDTSTEFLNGIDTIEIASGKILGTGFIRYYNNSVQWQFGYEVGVIEYSDYYSTTLTRWSPVKYLTHKEYLDENKKPLSKSIVVWQTKEIK